MYIVNEQACEMRLGGCLLRCDVCRLDTMKEVEWSSVRISTVVEVLLGWVVRRRLSVMYIKISSKDPGVLDTHCFDFPLILHFKD